MWRLAVTTDAGKADVYAQALEPMASVVSIYEIEPDYPTNHKSQPEEWATDVLMSGTCVVEALFEVPPTTDDLTASLAQAATALREALPPFSWERLEDQDWVRLSQSHHPAIVAGKVLVRPSHVDNAPPASVAIKLDAGRAFGTGGHCTTYGCLMALQKLHFRPQRIVDIGTGSGLLAIAAAKTSPNPVIASDIDPVAVEVAEANARANGVAAQLRCIEATGFDHPDLAAAAPYDLIFANILKGPLIALAADMRAHMADGGYAILSGILNEQADDVIAAYAAQGFGLAARDRLGEWTTITISP